MAGLDPSSSTWSARMLSILRIVAALLFITHGTQKLFGIPPLPEGIAIPLYSLPWIAGVLEVVGGPLLLLGLFTRPVAFILSGEMAVAYFMAHAPQSFWPVVNAGEPAILFCFLFLYLSLAGGGAWSLDRLRQRQGPV